MWSLKWYTTCLLFVSTNKTFALKVHSYGKPVFCKSNADKDSYKSPVEIRHTCIAEDVLILPQKKQDSI